MSNYISFSDIINKNRKNIKHDPKTEKIFNQFFDVFGEDQRTINNINQVKKLCPNFKRHKKGTNNER